jgi:hypothetical protein
LPTSIFTALLPVATSISEEADETISTIFSDRLLKTVGDAVHRRLAILLCLQLEPGLPGFHRLNARGSLGNSQRCRPLKRIQTRQEESDGLEPG